MPDDEVRSLPDRLRQVQEDVDDAAAALRNRRKQRRELVVRTVDEGVMSQRAVARALGNKSPGLVVKILASDDSDEE